MAFSKRTPYPKTQPLKEPQMAIKKEVNRMYRDMQEDGLKPGLAKRVATKKTNTDLKTGKNKDKKKKPTLKAKVAKKKK